MNSRKISVIRIFFCLKGIVFIINLCYFSVQISVRLWITCNMLLMISAMRLNKWNLGKGTTSPTLSVYYKMPMFIFPPLPKPLCKQILRTKVSIYLPSESDCKSLLSCLLVGPKQFYCRWFIEQFSNFASSWYRNCNLCELPSHNTHSPVVSSPALMYSLIAFTIILRGRRTNA